MSSGRWVCLPKVDSLLSGRPGQSPQQRVDGTRIVMLLLDISEESFSMQSTTLAWLPLLLNVVSHSNGGDDIARDVEKRSLSGYRVRLNEHAIVVAFDRVQGIVGDRVQLWFKDSIPVFLLHSPLFHGKRRECLKEV